MRILGLPVLERFKRTHADSRRPLEAWQIEVQREVWTTPQDIRRRYRSADFLAGNRVIFSIKGNAYRLVVKVRYRNDILVVEWVGTHADYGRKRFD